MFLGKATPGSPAFLLFLYFLLLSAFIILALTLETSLVHEHELRFP